jgi:hypothetical protein
MASAFVCQCFHENHFNLQMTGLTKNPLAGLAALGLAGAAIPSNTGGLNPTGINNCNCRI